MGRGWQLGAVGCTRACTLLCRSAILCRNMYFFALCRATLCLIKLYCATLQCHTTQTVFLFQVTMSLPTGRPDSSLSQAKADPERFSCFPFERVISTQQFQYTMTTWLQSSRKISIRFPDPLAAENKSWNLSRSTSGLRVHPGSLKIRGGNRLHSQLPSECDYLQSTRVFGDIQLIIALTVQSIAISSFWSRWIFQSGSPLAILGSVVFKACEVITNFQQRNEYIVYSPF